MILETFWEYLFMWSIVVLFLLECLMHLARIHEGSREPTTNAISAIGSILICLFLSFMILGVM